MHLTFVNTEGLEYTALSISAVAQPKTITMLKEDEQDSDNESEYLVVDENCPLLLDIDPPGTQALSRSRERRKSYLTYKINKKRSSGVPWVIVFTALGMAAMVVIGFVTMFQDTASINNDNSTDLQTGVVDDIDGAILKKLKIHDQFNSTT